MGDEGFSAALEGTELRPNDKTPQITTTIRTNLLHDGMASSLTVIPTSRIRHAFQRLSNHTLLTRANHNPDGPEVTCPLQNGPVLEVEF
jgi:hypothetical protein